ncbi:MAG TPA: ARMT1-like domain-containing protein [bacterium]|nr:ARMT1-like domain-containing protein [bacterium]HPN36258.1 ARMT1-like domain-containing protein [bacterium]
MKTYLDCIPCILRQALESARTVSSEPLLHEQMLRYALQTLVDQDLTQSPPVIGQLVHRRLRELTGEADPYRAAKERFNRLTLQMLPELTAFVENAADSFESAVRLAIAGNVIDLGVHGDLDEEHVRRFITEAQSAVLTGDVGRFKSFVQQAEKILYLTDNAGEIVLDRLLIERLPLSRVTVAVRGEAILNDATREDAQTAGLDRLVRVMDNGSDAPGTLLEDCSQSFQRCFHESDLIIAKGQGNFETLSQTPGNIFFLFKAKCPVIAAHAGVPLNAMVIQPTEYTASI